MASRLSVSSDDTLHEVPLDGDRTPLQKVLGGLDDAGRTADVDAESAKVWVPKQHANRTLVLCFDGTGDQFDSDNSNVVQLVSMLRKDDTTQQLVYYQPGIGTYTGTELPVVSSISKTLDDMFATNLSTHIKQGYEFLMQNYTQGDRICLFGFSRGAYTARALAGMLQKVGLLPLSNHAQLPFAYDMYADVAVTPPPPDASEALLARVEEEIDLVETFKRTFCRVVKVEFLGVWDTVASVGFFPRYLPFVVSNNGIRHLRHALALDERRVKFLPSLVAGGHTETPPSSPFSSTVGRWEQAGSDARAYPDEEHATIQKMYEDMLNARDAPCDVQEVWFAGVHADVGGGSVHNSTPHALARIPLRWMIRETFRCGSGIVFDAAMLQQIGIGLVVDVRSGGDVSVALDLPSRVRGDAPLPSPSSPSSENNEEDEDNGRVGNRVGEGWSTFLYTTATALLHPLVALIWGRTAGHGWISDSARSARSGGAWGRHVLPGRMRAHRVLEKHGWAETHPHAVDVLKSVGVDPGYEAREERRDACSPMFDQLAAARGSTRLFWLAMEYLPMSIKHEKAIVNHEHGGWQWIWNRCRGRQIYTDAMHDGLKVHRSVKTRLEAHTLGLSHPLSRHGEDTHVVVALPGSHSPRPTSTGNFTRGKQEEQEHGNGNEENEEGNEEEGREGKERVGEVYVPQVRPHFAGRHRRPTRLTHGEWNVEVPRFWEWVD